MNSRHCHLSRKLLEHTYHRLSIICSFTLFFRYSNCTFRFASVGFSLCLACIIAVYVVSTTKSACFELSFISFPLFRLLYAALTCEFPVTLAVKNANVNISFMETLKKPYGIVIVGNFRLFCAHITVYLAPDTFILYFQCHKIMFPHLL